jgi:hypothetical protein
MTVLEIERAPVTADDGGTRPERPGESSTREIRHEYTSTLPPLLTQLGVSLLVSTYQARKVVAVGVGEGELSLSYYNFERAMGLAVRPDGIAVGARALVWFLKSAADLAARVEPVGRHDACFLARSAHVTGEIHADELAWAGDELWVVNTAFSCLCTLVDSPPRLCDRCGGNLRRPDAARCPLPGAVRPRCQPRRGRADLDGTAASTRLRAIVKSSDGVALRREVEVVGADGRDG